jgi:CheY-like chemotaxis protein
MNPAVAAGAAAAWTALEASRLRAEPFRLLLLDAHMPDGDGFSVVERMRDDPSCADVTIILLASDLGGGDLRRCRELGISRHLVKPITPSELFNAVVEAVGGGSSPAPAAAGEAMPGSAPRRSLRVLVAEDNRVNQLVISRMLEQLSHTVVVCGDGQQVVAAVQDQHADLILMDLQMPVMDGFAATAAIRRREAEEPTRPRIPIVALTAFAMKGDRERCLAAGMDDYLSKPIRRDQLAALLARLESEIGQVLPIAVEASRDLPRLRA